MKKIAVIGGGFTGLTAGVTLADQGYQVKVFEAGEKVGGLAGGLGNEENWKWSLEKFYHHIFTGDREIRELAKKVGVKTFFKKPLTASFFHLKETALDSPMSLLKFSGISPMARWRMGAGLAFLKIIPNGLFLEKYQAVEVLPKLLGQEGYETIWKKLLTAKFGPFVNEVNMAWFWSRVAKRSQRLGYFEGGFQNLAEKAQEYIEKRGGEVETGTRVEKIEKTDRGIKVNGELFDKVIITTPAETIKKMLKGVEFPKINYLWGQTLVLETTQKIMKSYWLNILEKEWPFLVAVEHTNFMDKKNYGNKRLVYLGNYLPEGDKQLKMTKEQLLKLYSPFIRKIYKGFDKKKITNLYLFREPFAQPVFPTNYSKKIPQKRTLIEEVYLANMSMVYPFDRGTNYAVQMGKEVAEMVMKDLN